MPNWGNSNVKSHSRSNKGKGNTSVKRHSRMKRTRSQIAKTMSRGTIKAMLQDRKMQKEGVSWAEYQMNESDKRYTKEVKSKLADIYAKMPISQTDKYSDL